MGQFQIPLSMPGGFKNLQAAKKHREIVSTAQSLRAQASETAQDLQSVDKAEVSSTPSDQWTDLADGLGHVIMVGDNDDGSVRGIELNYSPETGQVQRLQVDIPSGVLTQTGDQSGDLSPTYKWETKTEDGEIADTLQFRFDDARQTLSITDPDNNVPAIFGDVNPKELTGGLWQQPVPIIQEPSKSDLEKFKKGLFQSPRQGFQFTEGGLILPEG